MSFIRPTAAAATGGAFALLFPTNSSFDDNTSPYAVIEFANPASNGLGVWGPSGAGVTVIRKIRTTEVQTGPSRGQPGYYGQFWYSQGDGGFNGAVNPNWGFHPYPISPPSGNTHNWEIASKSLDFQITNGGSAKAVAYGTTMVQAIIARRVSSTIKRCVAYLDLPSTAAANILDTGNLDYNDGEPPTPKITIGDSPWYAAFQHEKFGGVLDSIKIFGVELSQADIVSEAGDFSQIVTSAGQANIWWGKNGFDSVDDLTCDFGTGRSFTRNDSSNLITTTARL